MCRRVCILLLAALALCGASARADDASLRSAGRAGCADLAGQGLRGRCIDADNFLRGRELGGLLDLAAAGDNGFARDALGTPETDAAAAQLARELNQRFGAERVFRIDGDAGASASLTPLGARAGRQRAAVPAAALAGARALVHTHPTDANEIVPGDQDWQVAALGLPNYIAFGERVLVVEISGGQIRARGVAGRLSADERAKIALQLARFQQHGAER